MHARVRVSGSAPSYLRLFCEEIANDLAHLAIYGMCAKHEMIMKEEHIFINDCENLPLSHFRGLFANLPAFATARKKWLKLNSALYLESIIAPLLSDLAKIRDPSVSEHVARDRAELEQFIAEAKKRATGVSTEEEKASAAASAVAPVAAAAAASSKKSARSKTAPNASIEMVTASSQVPPDAVAPTKPASAADAAADEEDESTDLRFTSYIKRVVRTITGTMPEYAKNKPRASSGLIHFIDEIISEFVKCVAVRALIYIESIDTLTISDGVIQEIILSMIAEPSSLDERVVDTFVTETKKVRQTKPGDDKGKGKEATVVMVDESRMIAHMTQPAFMRFVCANYPVSVRASPKKPAKEDKPEEDDHDEAELDEDVEEAPQTEVDAPSRQPAVEASAPAMIGA
jgi:hypothetical protein